MKNRGKIAIGEILVLVVATFAFAWMISGVNASAGTVLVEEKAKDTAKKITLKGAGEVIKNFAIIIGIYYTSRNIARRIGVGGKEDIVGGATALAQIGTPYIATESIVGAGASEWIATHAIYGISPLAIATFVITTAIFYRDTKTKTVVFDCKTWDAGTGGSKCEECNKQGILTCSEYQCHALGQNCVIKEGACVWNNKRDTKPPVISVNNAALLDGYEYKDKNERGVRIVKKDSGDCVSAFTPLAFGIDMQDGY